MVESCTQHWKVIICFELSKSHHHQFKMLSGLNGQGSSTANSAGHTAKGNPVGPDARQWARCCWIPYANWISLLKSREAFYTDRGQVVHPGSTTMRKLWQWSWLMGSKLTGTVEASRASRAHSGKWSSEPQFMDSAGPHPCMLCVCVCERAQVWVHCLYLLRAKVRGCLQTCVCVWMGFEHKCENESSFCVVTSWISVHRCLLIPDVCLAPDLWPQADAYYWQSVCWC